MTRVRFASDRGSAIVELAVAMPLLVLILAATIDFARVFHTAENLQDAARAGAQYGSSSPANSSNTATMQSTATGATSLTGVSATASRLCKCATSAGVYSNTSPANDCTSAESTVCPSGHRVITVTVTTTKAFSTIFTGVLPGILHTTTLTRQATMEVVR